MKYYFDTVDQNRPYFKNQLIKTYLSTIDFISFINSKLSLKNKHIIDLGCGNCSNLFYINDHFQTKSLTGIERNSKLHKYSKSLLKKKELTNKIFLHNEDMNLFKSISNYDLLISIQTLSFIENIDFFLKNINKNINHKSIAINTLCNPGFTEFDIKIKNYSDNGKIKNINFHHFFSIEVLKLKLRKLGYKKIIVKKYYPKEEIKKKKGTSTLKYNGKLLPVSFPFVMSWYFVLAIK